MTPAQSLNYFKNKTNGIGAVAQSTAKTASLISGAASFSFLSNALSGITSLIGKQVSWQNNMDAKLSNLKLQGTSVSGADDVNLMSYYCNNKLKIFTYRPREEDLKILSDLFFYCGYNNPTTERPRLNTRYWFNFIQCEPTFTQEGNSVYNDFIEDVKARYEAGVTVYHYHENYAENG